ncbi:MAG: ABC transporter ATP-binding protein [Anaerolineae bacterium]|nr:ABC transporter ATP-binding protein [Anaerolineae bacterium]
MNQLPRLWAFIKPYKSRALLALVALTVLVCLDLAIPRLIQRIIDEGIAKNDQALVIQTALIMIGISAFSTLIAIGNNIWSIQVGEGLARDLREALFLKIQSFSFGNLDQQRTGQLMVRLTSDVTAVKQLVQISLRIGTRAPLLMLGSLVLMVNTSRDLALTLLPLILITSALIVFFVLRTEPLYRSVQQRLDKLNTVLQENIAGVRLVKAFVRADFEGERFGDANHALASQSIKVMQFMSSMGPILTMCVNIGMVLVIWAGGLRFTEGGMTLGQIVAFTNYLLTAMAPLIMMTLLSAMSRWPGKLTGPHRGGGGRRPLPRPLGPVARPERRHLGLRHRRRRIRLIDGRRAPRAARHRGDAAAITKTWKITFGISHFPMGQEPFA